MSQKNSPDSREDKTISQELIETLAGMYESLRDWLRPNKSQPVGLQVLMFILKLPVLCLVLLFSPIALVVLVLAFILVL